MFFCLILLTPSLFAKSLKIALPAEWKFNTGDSEKWSEPSFDDSDWSEISVPGFFSGDEDGFFWIRKEVQVPSEFDGQRVFVELGSTTASLEIFVDGVLVARHGTIYPKAHVSHVDNTVFEVPLNSIHEGKANIAIRAKCNMDTAPLLGFIFVDEAWFLKTKIWQPVLNTTVYYMMAAVCFFLFCYFLLLYYVDRKEKVNLFFSLTLIFISAYFLDMASEFVILPFAFQLALSRISLLFSVGFLTIFMLMFFNMKHKIFDIIIGVVFVIYTVLYAVGLKNAVFMDTVFTLSLIPVFGCIIFIYVIFGKAVKNKVKKAKIMLTGVSFAMLFGVHDIVFQVTGNIPFAWLQGFAFFFIDMTMYVVILIDTITNKKAIKKYAATTEEQKDKLNLLIQNAANLSNETMEIATALNESVSKVAMAAQDSAEKAKEIGDAVKKQDESIQETSNIIGNLTDSVQSVKNEVNTEIDVVKTTVTETGNLIEGVNSVSEVIENAASFSNSLGQVAQDSNNAVGNLVQIMETVKNNSKEILAIAKIVSDFSSKTDMLAMNASIEAAHSGAAGKGFSVIAHEIKGLAAASGAQSEKINLLVKEIDQKIGEGFDLSKNVQSALKKVSDDANATSEKVSESARSMEIQREAGKRITEATRMMSSSAEKVKNESDQQNSYSETVSESMRELASTSLLTKEAVQEIVERNQLLSSQAFELSELASRAKEAASGLNELIRS
ncbi:MAG: hypothetical protein K5839_00555 [Treponemataceae bacterium]|nr:hypothetical protein [Treponemataceae bacterium]